MAGLLNTTYNDPRASVLMGKGNTNVTDDQIRAFVNANVNDPSKILGSALSNNISIGQYAKAVGIPESQARAFITQQGINLNPSAPPPAPPVATTPPPAAVTPPPVVVDKIDAPKPVAYNNVAPPPAVSFNPAPVTTTRVNQKTDTVKGQVEGMLKNPNDPLMVTSRALSDQGLNRRGLLNTSLRDEHALKAMVDKAIEIGAPDAATYSGTARENTAALNQGAMFNSQYGLLASQANAENALKAGMFNSENQLKTGLFNADNTFRTGAFNSDLSSKIGMFNADTSSKVGMFNAGTAADILNRREANAASILNNRESLASNQAVAKLDVDTKLAIADLQLRSEQLKLRAEESKLGTSLMDSMADRIAEIDADDRIPPEEKKRMIDYQISITDMGINFLETFESSGVKQMLTGFKSSAPADQSTTENAEDEKPVTQNINGNPITGTDAKLINQLNQKHGTNFKPEQLVSQSEKQAIKNDPVYQYDPKRYMRDNGIVEYTYMAKDGKQATYRDLLLWT